MLELQILHASDFEGGVDAIGDAPAFATIVDFFEGEAEGAGIPSITLTAGDNYLPGAFFTLAGEDEVQPSLQAALEAQYALAPGTLSGITEGAGRIDITIANLIGVDAAAIGNHEFDLGPDTFAGLIQGSFLLDEDDNEIAGTAPSDIAFLGAQFPYLSANLDFSAESAFDGLVTDEILQNTAFAQTPDAFLADGDIPKIASSTIIEVPNGDATDRIGVIGATTQRLEQISSPGDVSVIGANGNDLPVLAQQIQAEIDALEALGVNKIVLVSHLQQFALENELAMLLDGIDVIIAGGSDTIVGDENDRLRPGDELGDDDGLGAGGFPVFTQDASGNDVAVVSTDGSYSYVGRLVIEFDEDGNIVPQSVDADESGPFATDEQGVLDVTGANSLDEAIDASTRGSEVASLVSALDALVAELDANAPGFSTVYLDGRRSEVRTEETNLGNLAAEAALVAARDIDPTIQVSLRNGGGIRADIGAVVLDNDGNEIFNPPVNNTVTDLDISEAFRFNNGLAGFTTDTAGLKVLLEHAVAASGDGSTQGRFPQVAGLSFEVDFSQTAQEIDADTGEVLVAGERVRAITLLDADGAPLQKIVENGVVFDSAPTAIGVTSLGFLVGDPGDLTGGDGYPFRAVGTDFRFFTDAGGIVDGDEAEEPENVLGEQQALAQFLAANHPTLETAFDEPELPVGLDGRLQQLDARSGTAGAPVGTGELDISITATFQGESEDADDPEGASEVVSYDDGRLFVTNGNLDRIDIFDLGTGGFETSIDLTALPGYDGVQSVAVGGGLIVAVVDVAPTDGVPNPGIAALYDQSDNALITTVATGNLPDSVSISPDGTTVIIANEGEFNSESDLTEDAAGTITLIDVSDPANPVVTELGFGTVDTSALRVLPGIDPALDIEPEFTTFSPDGSLAFVSLQENNGIAVIDVASATITGVLDAGTVDHSVAGSGIDTTDDTVIDIETRDVLGLRMPDAIAAVEIGDTLYLLGANEGDGRGDAFDDDGNPIPNADEFRVGDLADLGLIDPGLEITGLERLIVSTIDGDTDGDGLIDEITTFGSRSFTIWDSAGTVVFDSGDDFERIIAQRALERFNNDDGDIVSTLDEDGDEIVQNRSDAKGPEPEAMAVGEIDGETYAFIGAERDSGLFVYNISDPANAYFVDYIGGFENGNVGPETIVFIDAAESETDNAQIAVAYEISGNTVVYDLENVGRQVPVPTDDALFVAELYQAVLGRTGEFAGGNFWINAVQSGLSATEVAQSFLDSAEYAAINPELSVSSVLSDLYDNTFGSGPDEAGEAYWGAIGETFGVARMVTEWVNGDAVFATSAPETSFEAEPGIWLLG